MLAVTVAEFAIVKLLKVKVPELEMTEPLLKVIVPEVGANVHVDPLVRVPATAKLIFAVTAVDEQDVVRLKKVSEPPLVIEPPPLTVIVPAAGVNVPVDANVPATVAV